MRKKCGKYTCVMLVIKYILDSWTHVISIIVMIVPLFT